MLFYFFGTFTQNKLLKKHIVYPKKQTEKVFEKQENF